MALSPDTDLSDWYLDEDAEMGEGRLQKAIINLLLGCLQALAKERGWSDYVLDSDQFVAWREEDPNVRVAPDIYLMWDAPQDLNVPSWQTWREGHPRPVFVVEVVSQDWRKDYRLAPEKYDDLGVDELIVFDPWATERPSFQGRPFQLYRRDASGRLRAQPSDPRGVWSVTFGAYIVSVPVEGYPHLRVARSLDPLELIPSPQEVEAAMRRELEAQRVEIERMRAEFEAERNAERQRLEVERNAERQRLEAERNAERQRLEAERAEKERLLSLLAAHGIEPKE